MRRALKEQADQRRWAARSRVRKADKPTVKEPHGAVNDVDVVVSSANSG